MGLDGLNKRIARMGEFGLDWGGCIFLVYMVGAVTYLVLNVAVPELYDSETRNILIPVAVIIIFEVVMNLLLFRFHSKSNCVTHWQRQACVADLCRQYAEDSEDAERENLLEAATPDDVGVKKFCVECNREAPLRSHHCPLCRICVLRKDHHCFFTGACVGLGNQRFFIVFLFWCCVGLSISMPYVFQYIRHCSTSSSFIWMFDLLGPIAIGKWMYGAASMWSAYAATLFSFMMGSFMGALGFFGSQIYYTSCGYTMYEYHHTGCREAFDGDGFTVGERFRLVFGKHWLANFLFPQIWNQPLLTPQIANNLFRVRSKLL